jgi:hypothetical protein
MFLFSRTNTMRRIVFLGLVTLFLAGFVSTPKHYHRLLCIGNSLTHSAPAPAIGWHSMHGMAASQPDRDYCHRVHIELAIRQGFVPELAIVSTDVNRWHNNPTGVILFQTMTAAEYGADLVIVQMGDNAKVDVPYDDWLDAYQQITEWTPNARRIALGVWSLRKPQHEKYIQRVAAETDMQYIQIRDLHTTETEARQYTHAGVAWHPNDIGMDRIAQRVIAALHPTWLPWITNGEGSGTIPGTIP